MSPEIIVTYICPPIPVRSFDYCATLYGSDPEGNDPAGYGATEAAAIAELQAAIEERA
jgi:hypothetical protein